MLKLIELIADLLLDLCVVVHEQVDPPGADGVEIAIAVKIMEPHALPVPNGNQRQALMAFHLRAGMPHRSQAALQQFFVIHVSVQYGAAGRLIQDHLAGGQRQIPHRFLGRKLQHIDERLRNLRRQCDAHGISVLGFKFEPVLLAMV